MKIANNNKKYLYVTMIAIIILEICGFKYSLQKGGIKIVFYYTQLSNLVTLASAVLMLYYFLANKFQPAWMKRLRYLSTCMLLITSLITVCVLIPMGGDLQLLMFKGFALYHHTLVPLVSILSYIYLEPHVIGQKSIYDPVIVSAVYGAIMVLLNMTGTFSGPYPFFKVNNKPVIESVVWLVALLATVAGISWCVLRVTRTFKL